MVNTASVGGLFNYQRLGAISMKVWSSGSPLGCIFNYIIVMCLHAMRTSRLTQNSFRESWVYTVMTATPGATLNFPDEFNVHNILPEFKRNTNGFLFYFQSKKSAEYLLLCVCVCVRINCIRFSAYRKYLAKTGQLYHYHFHPWTVFIWKIYRSGWWCSMRKGDWRWIHCTTQCCKVST